MTTVIDRYKEEIKSLNDEIENLKRIIHTRATPSADPLAGLVRYEDWFDCFNNGGMRKDPHGEYVRYDQAAAVVAAKDAEIKVVEGDFIRACNYAADVETRAEAAEAELDKTKMLLQNERDQQVHEELAQVKAELDKLKAQDPVAWMYVNEDGECEQIEYDRSISEEYYLDPSITLLYAAPVSDSLKAENERYKEALQEIAGIDDGEEIAPSFKLIARAALKGDSNDKG